MVAFGGILDGQRFSFGNRPKGDEDTSVCLLDGQNLWPSLDKTPWVPIRTCLAVRLAVMVCKSEGA